MASRAVLPGVAAAAPLNFLFADSDELASLSSLIERPDIAGVQVVYSWKTLEKAPGKYAFTTIKRDLALPDRLHRKLFIQLQDRNVPD